MPFSPLAKLAAAALVIVSAAVNAQQRDEAVLKAAEAAQPSVLESLGLAGWSFHDKDEYIEIDSIVPRLYLISRLLHELGTAH